MDKLNKREFLKTTTLLGAAAFPAAVAAEETSVQETTVPGADLLDDHFTSESGWHFGSQAIHHGEQNGYQVTPISQDKCAPAGYQRPGNLRNPTVATLLRKVMEMDGTEAAVGGPCGMSMISQTYMALLKPGDRVVAHRCNYDWVMTMFRDYLPSWGIECRTRRFQRPTKPG